MWGNFLWPRSDPSPPCCPPPGHHGSGPGVNNLTLCWPRSPSTPAPVWECDQCGRQSGIELRALFSQSLGRAPRGQPGGRGRPMWGGGRAWMVLMQVVRNNCFLFLANVQTPRDALIHGAGSRGRGLAFPGCTSWGADPARAPTSLCRCLSPGGCGGGGKGPAPPTP